MTPLAQRLAKQLLLPVKDRHPFWQHNGDELRKQLTDIHCFECSGTWPLLPIVKELFEQARSDHARSQVLFQLFFLPAPKTWLEFKFDWSPHRLAILATEIDEQRSGLQLFSEETACALGILSNVSDDFVRPSGPQAMPPWLGQRLGHLGQGLFDGLISHAHVFLLLINSPKIIGRRQFMPNAGLERRLSKSFGVGSFPLHAWSEIKLQVSKPVEIDDGEPHEAHLTGKRALHFCRKHIRIRLGRLEYVSAHWRGDPAIGIKQSRYKVVA